MTSPSEKGLCTICDAPTHGLHFGVSTCKACASFFRRSMVERKRYKCRFQANCVISHTARNQCRACRLHKCYNNGMVREPSPAPTDLTHTTSSTLTSPASASASVLSPQSSSFSFSPQQPVYNLYPLSAPLDTNVAYPRIGKLLKAFCSFQESLKSLYKAENPHSPHFPVEFRQAEKLQHDRLETATASLIMSMVNEYFPSFFKLDGDARVKIFRPFAVRFSILYRLYVSAMYFNKEGDNRICTHFGYYNSLETLNLFFGDLPQIENVKALGIPIFTKVNQVKRKVVKLGLRELDAAAIVGYLFLNEIDDLIGLNEEDAKYRAEIQTEHFHNILATYGFERAGTQLADVLGLIVDINNICVLSTESMILGDLVLPKNKHLHTYLYADITH